MPLLQAFLRLSSQNSIPLHLFNMTTDYIALRRPEYVQQMIIQKSLDFMLQDN